MTIESAICKLALKAGIGYTEAEKFIRELLTLVEPEAKTKLEQQDAED